MTRPVGEQVMVITGASSGIGRVTAREAARRGARVVLAARNGPELDTLAEEIRGHGGEALPVPGDVTDYAQMEALARAARDRYGRIDTWVNNAGVTVYGTFKDVPLEDFRQVLDVTFMGQVHGAKAALPYLDETAGALICIGSAVSNHGVPVETPYSAAKHALEGWLDGLRVELMREGSPVRVTLVRPATINTPFFEHARTYLGGERLAIPPVFAPEVVARAILLAAETDRRDVYPEAASKTFHLLDRLSPRLLDLILLARGYTWWKSPTPKPPSAPSNLYGALEDDGGDRGHFTGDEKSRSVYQWITRHPVATSAAASATLGIGALAAGRLTRNGVLPAALLASGALVFAGKASLSAALAWQKRSRSRHAVRESSVAEDRATAGLHG